VDGAIGVMTRMNCSLATIQSQFGKGVLIGVAQVVGAARGGDVATLICAIVGGLVLILVYFGGLLLFPIFMIDVLMRVTIVTAISPLAFAAWLFRPTRRFAEKAAWQIAQAALTLVFMSIVGGLGKATLAYVFAHLSLNGEPAAVRDWAGLIEMLESQRTPSGQPFFIDLTTMAFYQLLGIGIILLFMLRQAGRMAADFAGVGGGDFSGALAGIAAAAGATGMAVDMAAGRRTGGSGSRRPAAVQDKAAQVAGPAGGSGP
jgi:type IV secretory pathway VirB6-like protein